MAIGIANSGTNFLPAALNKPSFAAMITRLSPNGSAPLFGLTSMLPSKTAAQYIHGYFSKTMIFPRITLGAGGQAAGDTAWTIVSNSNVMPGQIYRDDATGENIIINTVISATAVTVTRAVGTVAAAANAASQTLSMVGNAFEESSIRPAPMYITPVQNTNYTQIFRNSWGISDTMRASQVIAGDGNVAENRNDAALFHAADIEKAIFFGQKFLGTRNGQPFHTMDGLVNRILTDASGNITTAGATTNFTQLEAALDPMFATTSNPKASGMRVLFVGGTAHRVINNIGRLNGTYQMRQDETTFGLRFEEFKLTRGIVNVVEHPLFNSNSVWQKMAIAIDLSNFHLAYLGDRKTMYRSYNMANDGDAEDNGIDAVGGTFTTELTTEITNPSSSGVIFNLTAGAAG